MTTLRMEVVKVGWPNGIVAVEKRLGITQGIRIDSARSLVPQPHTNNEPVMEVTDPTSYQRLYLACIDEMPEPKRLE